MTSLLPSSCSCSPDSYKGPVSSPSSWKYHEEDRRQRGKTESTCYSRSRRARTWHSRCPQGRGTVLQPRASRCWRRCHALTPCGSFFRPCPRPAAPQGRPAFSTDSCPRCLWSQMRPGVSPEAHLLAYGRSQCDFTREGPAVCGEAVSPGDQQPHTPRPRAQSPPAKCDGSSTPITSDLQKCASC